MTPKPPNDEEAAAIAAALSFILFESAGSPPDPGPFGVSRPAWEKLERPRTWSDHARLEALLIDV